MVKRILAFALLAPSLVLFDAGGAWSTARPMHFVAPSELTKPYSTSSKESLTPSRLLNALAATPVPRAELPTGLTNPVITKTVATKTDPDPFHSLGEVTLNFRGRAYIFYSVFPTHEDVNLMNQQSGRIIGRLRNPVEHPPPSGFPSVSEMYLGRIKNYGFTAVMYVSGKVWVEAFAVALGPQNDATRAALAVAHLSVRHLREVKHKISP